MRERERLEHLDRWEENIKADFKELVWEGVNKWLGLEEAINLWVSCV
jgi:hypothetical protein